MVVVCPIDGVEMTPPFQQVRWGNGIWNCGWLLRLHFIDGTPGVPFPIRICICLWCVVSCFLIFHCRGRVSVGEYLLVVVVEQGHSKHVSFLHLFMISWALPISHCCQRVPWCTYVLVLIAWEIDRFSHWNLFRAYRMCWQICPSFSFLAVLPPRCIPRMGFWWIWHFFVVGSCGPWGFHPSPGSIC